VDGECFQYSIEFNVEICLLRLLLTRFVRLCMFVVARRHLECRAVARLSLVSMRVRLARPRFETQNAVRSMAEAR
jgi:hypothetical protein